MNENYNSVRTELLEVLVLLSVRLDATDVAWALTGSLGHALQGVPVDPHDIDLQTDASGAYRIEDCFSEFVIRPVEYSSAEQIRSHFGAFAVQGVTVEIMGAVQKRSASGRWERAVAIEMHRTYITVRGREVPVLNLDYESGAYEALGRTERAELLRRYSRGGTTSTG